MDSVTSGNVDHLFENYSIQEIEEIERKLMNEVELKKDDLRQLVGERYRDLIEVADTIHLMSKSCESVFTSIEKLDSFCNQLKFKRKKIQAKSVRSCELGPAVGSDFFQRSFNLILKAPSLICSSLDDNDALKALYIYELAKQDYLSLIERMNEILSSHFWNFVLNLEESERESEVAICLCCILVLENIDPETLFEHLLSKMHEEVNRLFSASQSRPHIVTYTFKKIFETFKIVHTIFFDDSGAQSLFLRTLMSFSRYQLPEMKKELHCSRKFSIPYDKSASDIEITVIKQIMKEWVEKEISIYNERMANILAGASSLSEIFDILHHLEEYVFADDRLVQWDEYCDALIGYYLPLWDSFLSRSFLVTVKQLLSCQISELFNILNESVRSILKSTNNLVFEAECFVWKSDSSDSLELRKKAFGITPILNHLCESFDSRVQELLSDIKIIGPYELHFGLLKSKDIQDIKIHFRNVCITHVYSFVDTVSKHISEASEDRNVLLYAQICKSLAFHCPSFKLCFDFVEDRREEWNKIQKTLLDCSDSSYNKYFEKLVNNHSDELKKSLMVEDVTKFVESTLKWDEKDFEETLEDGKSVKATVKMPHHISLPLNSYLVKLNNEINNVASDTLPKKLVVDVFSKIIGKISLVYEETFKNLTKFNVTGSAIQTIALQFTFDLLFLKQMLSSSRNDKLNREFFTTVQEVISLYETLIDPFDLHVVMPEMQNNIQKSIKGSVLLFGLVIPEASMTQFTAKKPQLHSDIQNIHNIMVSHILNNPFPLLTPSNKAEQKFN